MLLAMCIHANRVKRVADGEVNSQLFSNFLLLDFEQGLKLICVTPIGCICYREELSKGYFYSDEAVNVSFRLVD